MREHLKQRWSPRQISNRLRAEFPGQPEMHIVAEPVYQALYGRGSLDLAVDPAVSLRSGRTGRRPRRRKEHRTKRFPDMVMIRDRPAEVTGRLVPGHWEGDLIIGKGSRSAIATLVERTTRFIILVHLAGNRGAENLRDRLAESMNPLPSHLRRSLTWDQGTEMACHQDFTRQTLIPVFFCDPASPWQRGSNENTNGLLEWSPEVGHRISDPFSGSSQMYSGSTLSHSNAVSAVELFEQGLTAKSVALALDLAPNPVQMLYERWQIRGAGALMTRVRKQYEVETKLEIVRRHLQGVSGRVLAKEYDLPSPGTVTNWAKIYRRDGEEGLLPKKRGRPPANRENSLPESEVEQLRSENERLRAEVAYLGKLRALRSQERR